VHAHMHVYVNVHVRSCPCHSTANEATLLVNFEDIE
jgi:hypothetical protein